MTKSIETITPGATLGQIMSADGQAEGLLKAIGLDPAGREDKTLQSVCSQHKWSEVEILKWLKKTCQDRNKQNTEGLINLLTKIEEVFPRVHRIHGNQYPWLKNMQEPLHNFTEIFNQYFTFIDEEFYPFAKNQSGPDKQAASQAASNTENISRVLQANQKELRDLMEEIRDKGNNFKNPPVACSTLRILNQNLEMLFDDLEEQMRLDKRIFK